MSFNPQSDNNSQAIDPSQNHSERLIKKYANRRLYDTQTSTYITLDDVKQMVMNKDCIKVIDAKTQANLTRSILLQIILENEQHEALFSVDMLQQIIRGYQHSMQNIAQDYLSYHLDVLSQMHQHYLQQAKQTHGKHLSKELWQQWLNNNQQSIYNDLQGFMQQLFNQQQHIQQNLQTQWQVQLQKQLQTQLDFWQNHPLFKFKA